MRKVALLGERERLESSGLSNSLHTLRELEIETRVVFLSETENLSQELRALRAEGFDRALVCGGDGTLHFVIEALARLDRADRIPLGVVPLGTANDFAKGIGVQQEDLEQAVLHSVLSPTKPVDIGWVNDHPFVNVASGGGVAKNTTDIHPQLKTFLGRYAYYLNALLKLGQPSEHHLTVRGHGWEIRETCFAFAIGNNALAGGGFKIAPKAKLDDGLLDLLLIPSQSAIELTALAAELYKENPDLSQHNVIYRQDSEIFIDAAEELQLNLDGEPMSDRHFHFRIEPRSIEMVIGKPARELPHLAGDTLQLS